MADRLWRPDCAKDARFETQHGHPHKGGAGRANRRVAHPGRMPRRPILGRVGGAWRGGQVRRRAEEAEKRFGQQALRRRQEHRGHWSLALPHLQQQAKLRLKLRLLPGFIP